MTTPSNLGPKVSTRTLNWLDLVTKAWAGEFYAPDKGAYGFSKGRNFDSTDTGRTGIYGVSGDAVLLLDGTQYPDMRDGLQTAVGTPLGSAEDGYGVYQEIDADPRS